MQRQGRDYRVEYIELPKGHKLAEQRILACVSSYVSSIQKLNPITPYSGTSE